MPSSNSILSEFEWDEGMTIPVANAENKILEEEVCLLFTGLMYTMFI